MSHLEPDEPISEDTARLAAIGYGALSAMQARGLSLGAGRQALWPHVWPWAFGAVAVALAVYAVAPRSRPLCLVAGLALHGAVIGRIAASMANEHAAAVAGTPTPGSSLAGSSFLAAILLSSALVWRYLLWPLATRRPRRVSGA